MHNGQGCPRHPGVPPPVVCRTMAADVEKQAAVVPSLVVALHPSKEIGADDYPVTAEVVEQHHRGRQRQELEHEGVGQRFGLHPSWFGNESTSHEGVELRKRVQHGGIGQMQLKGRRWLLGDTLPWLVLALKRKAMVQDVLAAPLEDEEAYAALPSRKQHHCRHSMDPKDPSPSTSDH